MKAGKINRSVKIKEWFRKLHHKRFIRNIIHGFLNIAFPGIGFYARFIEPKRIQVTRTRVPLRHLPRAFDRFRIIHISDLHYGPTHSSASFFNRCIKKINSLRPDIVAMTGDFLQWDMKYAKPLVNMLSGIEAKYGVFASLGNHDYGVCHPGEDPTDPMDPMALMDYFREKKIHVLHNESWVLNKDGAQLEMIGLGDFWTSHFQPELAFAKKKKAGARIVLSHNPDSFPVLDQEDFQLMLSGHVHGGQISFPLIGPLAVPVKHRKFRRGLHYSNHHWLYTTRGLGGIFEARFGSVPEISCLELRVGD